MTHRILDDYVYDIETYVNMFSCGIVHMSSGMRWVFEVSDRRDDSQAFIDTIRAIAAQGRRMIGYNNEAFDWYIVQKLVEAGSFSAFDAYRLAQQIIDTNDRFGMTIWPNERMVPQIDLYKIHHFDNRSKSTSLKKLEVNMRSASVVDLPYSPHTPLTPAQMDHIIAYMCHDISETAKFAWLSLEQIEFREKLAVTYPNLGDVLNFNDTKIGKKYFEMKLEEAVPGICYSRETGRRAPRQTRRETIAMRDVISPKIVFQHPDFQRVKDWLEAQTLTRTEIEEALSEKVETKGVFKGLHATLDGFQFDFGVGGIHGSVSRQTVREGNEFEIVDVDVASYYPNLAISNNWYPQHLGETFARIYLEVYQMRSSFGKKTAENAMLKLALNGVYGDSNNIYGPFFDTQYTMQITVNGQLFLAMLAEWVTTRTDAKMIQANTDGLTVRLHRDDREKFDAICREWETYTGLTLESVSYKSMHVRDVNNYTAVKQDGSVKRIGAYAYETPLENPYTRELAWHKDHSQRVVMKAAEAAIVRGESIEDFIVNHTDPFDFMKSVKVPKSSRLEANGQVTQNMCRYYVSKGGVSLVKIMPGLKGGPERNFAVEKGWTVTICNDAELFDWSTVNWHYYIEEARKLLI
jgi:hypothetical protein